LVDLCGRQEIWLTKAGGANGTAIAYLDCSIRKPPKRFASQFSFGLRNRKGLCDPSPDSSSSSLQGQIYLNVFLSAFQLETTSDPVSL